MTQRPPTTDKRTAILRATLDLVAERGFHGTPMSQVAKRSKVSAGIIYHYFENKDDLIRELYRDVKARYSSALLTGNLADLSWEAQFERLWLNAFEFYVSHPQETQFLEQYENSPYGKHWDEQSLMEDADDNMLLLVNMIKVQLEAGVIRQMPYVVLHELTFGVAVNLAKRQINQAVTLDDDTLKSLAQTCRKSIEA